MKSMVINLDRATDRFEHVERTFHGQGIDFIRISAVDAKCLADETVAHWCSDGARLGPTELACFLSHRKCWQELIERDLPYAVIFEDDVLLSHEAGTILKTGDWIPAGADVIKLETNARATIVDKVAAGYIGKRGVKRLHAPHVNSVAYIVSKSGARKLLESSRRIDRPVDLFLFDEAGLERVPTYQLVPALCLQPFVAKRLKMDAGHPDLSTSAVEDDRRSRRPRGWKRMMHKLRRLVESSGALARGWSTRAGGKLEWGPIPFK